MDPNQHPECKSPRSCDRPIESTNRLVYVPGKISVVVPTYREVDNIPVLVPRLANSMTHECGDYEIIIVDDNSRDGSEEAVEKLAQQGLPVRIVVRTTERGLSTAVLRGFDESRGEYLVCLDADLSHPPETIQEMIRLLRSGQVDFVIGSRYCPGGSTDAAWGLFRWLNSRVAMTLAWPLVKLYDPMSGFFAMPRAIYNQATHLNPIGYKIALELVIKCRCRSIREVPIHFADRQLGKSKLSLKEQLNYLRHLWRLYSYKVFKR